MTVVSSTDHPAAVKRSLAQKIGIGISVLVGAFLVFDAAGKFMLPTAVCCECSSSLATPKSRTCT